SRKHPWPLASRFPVPPRLPPASERTTATTIPSRTRLFRATFRSPPTWLPAVTSRRSTRSRSRRRSAAAPTRRLARIRSSGRIGRLVEDTVEGMPWLGPFHSIGTRVLRRHAELVGLRSDFTILDMDDQIRLMKQLSQAEGIDEKRWPARQFAAFVDGWKNKGL